MLDEKLARMRAHRNNIHRYRRLLETKLSDIERQFIERRLRAEHSAMAELTNVTFPIHFASPESCDRTSMPGSGWEGGVPLMRNGWCRRIRIERSYLAKIPAGASPPTGRWLFALCRVPDSN